MQKLKCCFRFPKFPGTKNFYELILDDMIPFEILNDCKFAHMYIDFFPNSLTYI